MNDRFNTFFGAGLAAVLVVFGLNEVSSLVFGGHHKEEKLTDLQPDEANRVIAERYAYYKEVSFEASAVVEEVFDLGAALQTADPAAGEAFMKAQCASCHNWVPGGANKTGPNLYGVMGNSIGGRDTGFGYSSAFADYDGQWTYEEMNGFLENPSAWITGTSMSYAGIRRDGRRADVLAFLATISPEAPPPPEPEPEEAEVTEAASEDGDLPDTAPAAAEVGDGDEPPMGATEEQLDPMTETLDTTGDISDMRIRGGAESGRTEVELIPDSPEVRGESILVDADGLAEDDVDPIISGEDPDPETVDPENEEE